MWNKILKQLRPPFFSGNKEKTQAAELINSVVLGIIIITLLYTILARVSVTSNLLIIVVPLLLLLIGLLVLIRWGSVQLAGIGLVFGVWLILFYASLVNGGVKAPAFNGFIIVVMMGTLILGLRWGFAIAGLSVVVGGVFVWMIQNGTLPKPAEPISLFTVLLAQITYFIVAAVLLGFATSNVKKALNFARSSEERYRLITSVMSDYAFFVQFESDGQISEQWVSGAFALITGYSPDEYFSRGGWVTILHPDSRSRDEQDMVQLYANKKVISEVRIVRKDGGIRWVRAYAHPKWDDRDNRLSGIYGAVQDITEQKHIETSLRQREAILAIVAHSANLFLGTKDWKTEIDPFLEKLGRTMNVSHAYLFENHLLENGESGKSMRNEWSAPSISSDLDGPDYINKPLNSPELRVWYDLMKQRLPYIGDERHVSNDEMDSLRAAGIESLLDVPIFVNREWWGIIGFDDVTKPREWSNDEVEALTVAANSLGAALQRQAAEDALVAELAERKRTEQAFRFSEERFSKAFHTTPVLMTIEEAGRGFIEVNNAFVESMGYSRDEIIGHKPSELNLIPFSDDRQLAERLLKEKGVFKELELRVRRKSGAIGVVLMSIEYIDMGDIRYILTSALDITERKLAEADRERLIDELETKNEELERFTYTVSHDLKSPLVTINGFLGYLEQDAASGNLDRLKKDTQRIHEAVNKMQKLLSELLELSRIGRLMNPPETLPFEDMVQDALEIVQGRLNESGVTVHTQPNLPAVYGDKPRLIEVLQNLLDNAAKYMGDQPNPRIEVGSQGEDAERGMPVFFVKDNGMGIDPEHHERIFGLFNKLDAKSEGTGVGLALVKRIVEIHGGRIWIQSEAGNGSTFYFTLPSQPKPDSVI